MKCLLESRLNQPKPIPRKYQPNPNRHVNKSYPDGLMTIPSNQNGHQGSSNGTINNNAVNYQSIIVDDNNYLYDRPKSCLGYNKDCIPTLTTYYIGENGVTLDKQIRSKSETHLAIAQGETIGTNDNNQPGTSTRNHNGVCIGTTQAEVYYDATHSCSEDSEEEEQVEMSQNNTSDGNTNNSSNNGDSVNIKKNCNQNSNSNGVESGDNCPSVKNIYDLPSKNESKMSTIEGEMSQPIELNTDCTNMPIKCKPTQQLAASQSTSSHCPPEEIAVDHSGDLMKSLRCNVVPRGNNDYRNSPFSDSGFRSKYSPSPREGTLNDTGPIYPESKLAREPFISKIDPPINLPPPSISQLSDRPPFRREPITTRLNMATPTSSLV